MLVPSLVPFTVVNGNSKSPQTTKEPVKSNSEVSKNVDNKKSTGPIHPLIYLQKAIGNQAVQKVLNSQAVQGRLKISEHDDPNEIEAEMIADQVMRMEGSFAPLPEPQKKKEAGEKNAHIEKSAISQNTGIESLPAESGILTSTSGVPLSESARAFFESRFRHDFSNVRIHADVSSALAADALNAKAFTHGRDIYFASGHYVQDTMEGRRLLAHELAHTIQQTPDSSHAYGSPVYSAGNSLERDANTGVHVIETRKSVPRTTKTNGPQVARQVQPTVSTTMTFIQIGANLDSDNPAVRGSTLYQMAEQDDEIIWRSLLLALESRHEDVRIEAENIIHKKISSQRNFEIYFRELAASPAGSISDLAIRALTLVGGGQTVDIANYEKVIRQRLTLVQRLLGELDDRLYALLKDLGEDYPSDGTSVSSAVDDLDTYAVSLPIEELWKVGLRASRLLEGLGRISMAA